MNNAAKRRILRPRAMLYPAPVEVRFERIMYQLARAWRASAARTIIPALDHIIPARADSERLDAWNEDATAAMDAFRVGMQQPAKKAGALLTTVAAQIDKWNFDQWKGVVKDVFQVDPYRADPIIDNLTTQWIKTNTELITKIGEDTRAAVRARIEGGIRAGDRVETIKKGILSTDLPSGVFRKVEVRARLIARDQIGKLNGDYAQQRQAAIGITRYRWRTVRDERVRGNPSGLYPKAVPSHYDREGKIYKWNEPPIDGHPGEPIQCRCYAEPVFEDILPGISVSDEPITIKPLSAPKKIVRQAAPIPKPAKVTIVSLLAGIKNRLRLAAQDKNYSSMFYYRGQHISMIGSEAGLRGIKNKELLKGISDHLAELDKESARLGIPALRGTASVRGKTEVANMGDGILGVHKENILKQYEGYRYAQKKEVEGIKKIKDRFLKTRPLPSDKLRSEFFAKRNGIVDYDIWYNQKIKEFDNLIDDTVKKYEEKIRVEGLFKVSKWNPLTDSATDRPWGVQAYLEDAQGRINAILDHEYAHHLHQQMGKTIPSGISTKWDTDILDTFKMAEKIDQSPGITVKIASRYPLSKPTAKEKAQEAFAEYYALWKSKRNDLVSDLYKNLFKKMGV